MRSSVSLPSQPPRFVLSGVDLDLGIVSSVVSKMSENQMISLTKRYQVCRVNLSRRIVGDWDYMVDFKIKVTPARFTYGMSY